MAETIIHLPPPTELSAPAPQKRGIAHQFYYTGETSKPVYYRGRALWRVRFRYGIIQPHLAEQVREEHHKLLELGEGQVYLPIPMNREVGSFEPQDPVDETASINTTAKTITYTTGVAERLHLERPVQVDRYLLYPLPQTNVLQDEDDNPIYAEDGHKLLEEGSRVIRYPNMPDSLPTSRIRQGEGMMYILCRPVDIRPVEITEISRYQTRVADITLTEVP